MDSDEPSPRCSACSAPMRFVRSIPNFGALYPLRKFECRTCDTGHIAGAEIEATASSNSVVERVSPTSLSVFEMIRQAACVRFTDMRSADRESFDRLRTRPA